MISFLSGILFDFRTIGVLFVLTLVGGIFFSVRLNIRDRMGAGVERTTKHARASQRPEAAGISPEAVGILEEAMWAAPTKSRMFDGKVIFYGPRGPIDLTSFVRDVRLSSDTPDTLGSVNDSTARGDHGEAPDRPEYEGDQNRPTATRDPLDGDEPLRAGQPGSGKTVRAHDRDPFDGADPTVFGRA